MFSLMMMAQDSDRDVEQFAKKAMSNLLNIEFQALPHRVKDRTSPRVHL